MMKEKNNILITLEEAEKLLFDGMLIINNVDNRPHRRSGNWRIKLEYDLPIFTLRKDQIILTRASIKKLGVPKSEETLFLKQLMVPRGLLLLEDVEINSFENLGHPTQLPDLFPEQATADRNMIASYKSLRNGLCLAFVKLVSDDSLFPSFNDLLIELQDPWVLSLLRPTLETEKFPRTRVKNNFSEAVERFVFLIARIKEIRGQQKIADDNGLLMKWLKAVMQTGCQSLDAMIRTLLETEHLFPIDFEERKSFLYTLLCFAAGQEEIILHGDRKRLPEAFPKKAEQIKLWQMFFVGILKDGVNNLYFVEELIPFQHDLEKLAYVLSFDDERSKEESLAFGSPKLQRLLREVRIDDHRKLQIGGQRLELKGKKFYADSKLVKDVLRYVSQGRKSNKFLSIFISPILVRELVTFDQSKRKKEKSIAMDKIPSDLRSPLLIIGKIKKEEIDVYSTDFLEIERAFNDQMKARLGFPFEILWVYEEDLYLRDLERNITSIFDRYKIKKKGDILIHTDGDNSNIVSSLIESLPKAVLWQKNFALNFYSIVS